MPSAGPRKTRSGACENTQKEQAVVSFPAWAAAGGQTFADGNHHSSMIAFEDGKDATYHLYVYRGTVFEIIETIETSEDGQRLIRRERIKGVDGNEHVLTAELPVSPPIENPPNS